jgi:pyrroline-5-carboxylate reductase
VGGFKVAIIGAGRLGSLLADRIPATCRKVIISTQKAEAVALADEVGGVASDQMSAVRGCRVVFMAVAGPSVSPMLSDITPHLDGDALVVNMAVDVMTDELAAAHPGVRLAAVKVIGHAREMGHGSPGVVILDHVDARNEEHLRELVSGLGPVTRDAESKVVAAQEAVVTVMEWAAADLRIRLGELGLAEGLIQAAIATTGPGVLRSLAAGELGAEKL